MKSVKYPNNLTLAMHYNSKGYLQYQKNAANDYVYQEITGLDNYGNVNGAKFAENSQIGSYLYSARTGQMLSSKVSVGLNNVHYLAYTDYDSYGNLREQQNLSGNSTQTDTYVYDKLQRLMTSTITVGGQSTNIHYAYDAVGNLLKKTDYSANQNSAYQYASGTNRVMSVQLKGGGTDTFAYDTRGNLTTRNGNVEMAYNVFNKPTAINRLGASVTLAYDANWARYKQQRTVNGNTTTTYYIDKLYEVEVSPTGTKNTSYLGDAAVLVEEGTNKKIRYTHRDRLGSATTFVDHNAKVTAYRFYDPFGKPRMGDGSLMSDFGVSASLANNLLDTDMASRRGFTDHEHLDEVELIHMNGRVYDYNLGRFMSVDPFIHGGSQGLNPYSYIMNNPLSGTDPSGYEPEIEKKDITKKVAVTGSRIKRDVVVGQNVTITNRDSGGAITSVTSFDAMNDGSLSGAHITASNGKVDSVTVFGRDGNGEFSHTTDIGAQNKLQNESGGIGNTFKDPRPAPKGIVDTIKRWAEGIDHHIYEFADYIGNSTLATGVPDSIEQLADVGRRAANMIRTGHAGLGKELLYEESWFLYKFAPKGFELTVDARVIGNWGGIASPIPLDSTKVHGHISAGKNGLNPGMYDFHPIIMSNPRGIARIDIRNRLNRVAIEQHGVGNPFLIKYSYNDSDFQ